MATTVPRTPMYDRYKELPSGRGERLDQARTLAADPTKLVDDFAATIKQFADYDHREEPFHSGRPGEAERQAGEGLDRTIDLALRLRDSAGSVVYEHLELGFDYIERELAVNRTTGGATFPNGDPAGKSLVADLLLANREDRTPIIAEVKISTDKDPYAALIQAMACAAHLATDAQYERLMNAYPDAGFATGAGGSPRLDVYLIPVRFPETGATYMPELLSAAADLSRAVMQDSRVSDTVRRIACLEIKLDESSALTSTVRFVAGD